MCVCDERVLVCVFVMWCGVILDGASVCVCVCDMVCGECV